MMLTYQDIKLASSDLILEVSKRTVLLRTLAHDLVKTYTESLKLANTHFIDSFGKKIPYIDTYINEYGKLTPCTLGALALDENHTLNFVIKTAVNDEPICVSYVDIPIHIKIEQNHIFINLMENNIPIIAPLNPIEGQFEEVANIL
ncbi:hypothetical protein [Providencia hangzhouensis]|uniref:hypothetical protein n=1 Tax=Providencia hangzhouensis TaxID=3031799 RepID=UPI0034DCD5F9